MYNVLNAIAWFSRGKTSYDLSQAKSFDDIFKVGLACAASEILIYQAKQQIRNQYY